jgi:hypothetical protein
MTPRDETPAPDLPPPARDPAPAPARTDAWTPPQAPVPPARDPAGTTAAGVRATAGVVGAILLLELVLYLASVHFYGAAYGETLGSSQRAVWLFALFATIVVAARLPRRSRTAFLAGCAITVGAVVTILVVTCAVAVSHQL